MNLCRHDVIARTDGFEAGAAGLELPAWQWSFLDAVDGRTSLGELATRCGLDREAAIDAASDLERHGLVRVQVMTIDEYRRATGDAAVEPPAAHVVEAPPEPAPSAPFGIASLVESAVPEVRDASVADVPAPAPAYDPYVPGIYRSPSRHVSDATVEAEGAAGDGYAVREDEHARAGVAEHAVTEAVLAPEPVAEPGALESDPPRVITASFSSWDDRADAHAADESDGPATPPSVAPVAFTFDSSDFVRSDEHATSVESAHVDVSPFAPPQSAKVIFELTPSSDFGSPEIEGPAHAETPAAAAAAAGSVTFTMSSHDRTSADATSPAVEGDADSHAQATAEPDPTASEDITGMLFRAFGINLRK
jgi:hypothetical protein